MQTVPKIQIYNMIIAACDKVGVTKDDAAAMAEILLDNEIRGYASHGLLRVNDYIKDIRAGYVDLEAEPVIDVRSDFFSIIDGNRALGVRVIRALHSLVDKIKNKPVHFIAIRNAHHLGRLATLAKILTSYGYFVHGFENYNGHSLKVKPGPSSTGLLATNPIVYALPVENEEPIILDMTTSVVSEGAIRQHHIIDKIVPEGWLIDKNGKTVTDTNLFFTNPMQAFLAPLGGTVEHKGFGLGLIVELFASIFSGAGNIAQPHVLGGNSAFLMMYKPSLFGLSDEEVSSNIKSVCNQLKIKSNEAVRIPGRKEIKSTDVLQVSQNTWKVLSELGS